MKVKETQYVCDSYNKTFFIQKQNSYLNLTRNFYFSKTHASTVFSQLSTYRQLSAPLEPGDEILRKCGVLTLKTLKLKENVASREIQ